MTNNYMQYSTDNDGILTAIMDDPNGRVNVMNGAFLQALNDFILKLENEKQHYKGVVLTSAKSTFFAGGDLTEIMNVTLDNCHAYFKKVEKIKVNLRRLETIGIPIVAAINGAVLGGGFEICLACHHRVAFENPKTIIGLPEITLGLLPGGGGVIRLTRKIELETALDFLLTGKSIGPVDAKKHGLIETVTTDRESMMASAKQWILDNPSPVQPWDRSDFTSSFDPQNFGPIQSKIFSQIRQGKFGDGPGPSTVLDCAIQSVSNDLKTASTIETQKLIELALSPEAKQKIKAFFVKSK